MKAIQFDAAVPRYALGLGLRRIYPPLMWSGITCTYLSELPEPSLPAEDWVKVRTRLGGICGSDLGAIYLSPTFYMDPFATYPFTLGHENVGHLVELGEQVTGWEIGERVVVEPALWCLPRGFDDICRYCARGEINLCERLTEGPLSPGVQLGFCKDTGGSWSPYFTAHQAQLYRIPEAVSDENALMLEPFCIGLHAVLQNFPGDEETVLIYGSGTVGLMTIAALRALGSNAHVLAVARYPFQAEAALRLGASEVVQGSRGENIYERLARQYGARIHRPRLGKQVMVGGVDLTFECVGSGTAVDDALRLTRSGGTVVLIGWPGILKNVDWTAIFSQELKVTASFNYNHAEQFRGWRWKTFELALELMANEGVDLSWMVTHRFKLEEYDRAFRLHAGRGEHKILKGVFEFSADQAR